MRHRALCHCTFLSSAVFNMFYVTVQFTNSISSYFKLINLTMPNPSKELCSFLVPYTPTIQQTAFSVRELILETTPKVYELVWDNDK